MPSSRIKGDGWMVWAFVLALLVILSIPVLDYVGVIQLGAR